MWRLPGLLAVLAFALCAPAYAAPTVDQAAQIKAIRDALTVLEGLQNPPPAPAAPAPAPVPVASKALLSVLDHNANPAELAQFEAYLGRKVDAVSMAPPYDAANYVSAVTNMAAQAKAAQRPAIWSLVTSPGGADLQGAASGKYLGQHIQMAQAILAAQVGAGDIIIRPDWEKNGGYLPWDATNGKESLSAYAHVAMARAFKSVSPRFKMDWNLEIGGSSTFNVANAYPGDAWVDIVSLDVYRHEDDSPDNATAFNAKLTSPIGLNWLESFAGQHGKKLGIGEWGVGAFDPTKANAVGSISGPWITMLANWIKARPNVVYHQVYDIDGTNIKDFIGKMSDNRWPPTGAALRAAFGQ